MELMNTEYGSLRAEIADYLENGLLDNIIDMFKHDRRLYAFIAELMTDERIRVRIQYILPLLDNQNPLFRGDAAYLLGIIGQTDVIPFLKKSLHDEFSHIRIIAQEAIEEIQSKSSR